MVKLLFGQISGEPEVGEPEVALTYAASQNQVFIHNDSQAF